VRQKFTLTSIILTFMFD